jgi:catechol 2,3-dioxygenase-like lactoylglutathione lyase family enzyme
MYPGGVEPRTLDHVAFWLADRDAIADYATRHLGMHVIDRTDTFTLVGSDARRGKLTLFQAEGPRQRGALKHVALRVNDLAAAKGALPSGAGEALSLGEGVEIRLVEAPTDVDYDLDHVALYTGDPASTATAYRAFGFNESEPSNGVPRVQIGGAHVEFHQGDVGEPERPLLNHLAVLVDSAEQHRQNAEDAGIEVESFVDAENTIAVFLWGPDRVRIEYVEHKPTFSLS